VVLLCPGSAFRISQEYIEILDNMVECARCCIRTEALLQRPYPAKRRDP